MNWSQISVGAVAGAGGTWLLGILKSGIDHVLDERKQRAADRRSIDAEKREQDRRELTEQRELEKKKAEKDQAIKEKVKQHRAELYMICTKLRGCTDFISAADVIAEIHFIFRNHPQYIEGSLPIRWFLEKYPANLAERAAYASEEDDETVKLPAIKQESYDLTNFIVIH